MLPTLARRVRSGLATPRIIGRRVLGRDRDTPRTPDGAQTEHPAKGAPPPPTRLEEASDVERLDRRADTRAVVVLGGGSDIGIAIAAELVAHGAETVVLAGRNLERMREQALEAGIGVRLEAVPFDARHPESHVGAVEEAFTLAGQVQAVVLAFGVLGDTESYEANPALAGGAAVTNFAGAVSTSLAAARALARQERPGALIVLSSVAAIRPRPSNYVYGATKAGLDFFARGLAASVKQRGVRVLIVRPGFVETKMTRGMRSRLLGTTPDRVARDVVEALDGKRTVIWSPAILRWVSIVIRIAPGFVIRRL